MALITCPDCRSAVAPHAAACPYCGRPLQPVPRFVETPAGPAAETPAGWPGERPAAMGSMYGRPAGAAPMYGQPRGMNLPYDAQLLAAQKSAVQLVYGLYAGSFLFGPLAIVALVLSYIRRGEVRGTWLETHYAWVIDTFWMSMAVSFVGVMAAVVMMFLVMPMGIFSMLAVLTAAFGFPIYRLVVGWAALGQGRTPVGKLASPRW